MGSVTTLIPRPLVSSFNESLALQASTAPRQSPRAIPTEPKAFRGVPTEPRAMRITVPHLQKSCWQYPSGPRAIYVCSIPRYKTSQVAYSSNNAQGSISTPNQVNSANGLIHSDDTGHQQPLRAVASSPPRFRGDDLTGSTF